MDLATALIWTLRIALPIILFCIYFKLQSPEKEAAYPGPTTNGYNRTILLAHRKAVAGVDAPEEFKNLALKDAMQAPALFVSTPSSRGQRGGGGGGRRDNRDGGRDRRGGGGNDDRAQQRGGNERVAGGETKPSEVEHKEDTEAKKKKEEERLATEKMHTESVVNFVAFNRTKPQRIFLPDEANGLAPPPPPKKPGVGPVDVGRNSMPAIFGAAAEKANSEAQMVLRGSMRFMKSAVVEDVYEQLMSGQVEISESTFALMIEACVTASDLKGASDLLMKMEAAGYSPDSDLLDKVMDLYSKEKSQRDIDKKAKEEHQVFVQPPQPPQQEVMPSFQQVENMAGSFQAMTQQDDMQPMGDMQAEMMQMPAMEYGGQPEMMQMNEFTHEDNRANPVKLSSTAPIFVPSFAPQGAVPPPPPPQPTQDFTDQGSQRTKLSLKAKPFEPQMNVTYDPNMHTWSVEEPARPVDSKGEGKGEGKGKTKKDKGGKQAKSAGNKEAASQEQRQNDQQKSSKSKTKQESGSQDASKSKTKQWVAKVVT